MRKIVDNQLSILSTKTIPFNHHSQNSHPKPKKILNLYPNRNPLNPLMHF